MVFNKIGRFIKFFIFFIFFMNLNAEQVEVTADHFFADEIKLESVLSGNVKIKKGKFDTLDSDKVFIYFNKEKKPLKYKATGNARFHILINESEYKGKGNTLTYDPNLNTYTLEGNAYIIELSTKREVFGDKIMINQNNGRYDVDSFRDSKSSDKKPAKLIFQIEDKK